MALSPQWLDELRTRITLSALIGRTTKLQRAGNEWKACCPFHNEKSPSFFVNDAKGFYHCFGCEAHGDGIRWLTEQRGLAFIDAVKELAAEAGMELPAPDPAFVARAEQRATLHDVMQAAQDWFKANLASPEGEEARAYLDRRGIGALVAERFGFGYAPGSRTALKQALDEFEEPMLIEAGLRISVEDKEPYDRFRARLMLPIQDARGRVIAFGGRILEPESKAPKYLNSPDTPLFDKGRTLYNLHRAGPAARKTGRIVVVEGYMDVIALSQAGIEEVVAPMGTALTEQQLELLWRLIDKPILCFDGDQAGQRAAMRAIERALPLLRPGRSLQIVRLPAGLDPDDLVRREGRSAMERLLASPMAMLDVIWDHEQAMLPLTSPEDKAGLKARLLGHADAITDSDIRALYRRELLDRYSAFAFPKRDRPFRNNSLPPDRKGKRGGGWREVERPLGPDAARRLMTGVSGAYRDTLTQAVLAGFARYPEEIDRHAETLLRLAAVDPRTAEAIDLLIARSETLEAASKSPISLTGIFAPPADNNRFSFLVEGHDPVGAREELAEAITLLVERPALEAAIAAATARFDEDPEGAFAEQQRLRKRKLEIDGRLGQMARKRAASSAAEHNGAVGAYTPDAQHENGSKQPDGIGSEIEAER